ncbi:MAG: spore germination protein [Clostridiales bacterium]|nr:spore germination protein [Clostridiales bacterium]
MTFFELIKNLITYQKPTKGDRFELLEDYTERADLVDLNISNMNSSKSGQDTFSDTFSFKTPKDKKHPLDVDKWNEERRQKANIQGESTSLHKDHISKELYQNQQRIKQKFSIPKNKDIIIRDLKIGGKTEAFIVYVDGMADRKTINDYILGPLMAEGPLRTEPCFKESEDHFFIDYILKNVLSVNNIIKATTYDEVILQVLNGLTALFVDDSDVCIIIESQGYEKRTVDQPITETVISGPHEAFTESLRTNLTLVRRIIRNQNLLTEILPIGKTDNSKCGIMYIDGVVNNKVVDEVKRRIESIDIDFIMGSGMLNQLIEDHPFAIFPQILTTERPDRTASFLMEGKVIIICDGTPYASVVPVTFFHMFHSSEDSFMRWQFGTFIRFIRLMAFGLALFLPAFYIALTLYHPEAVPTELLLAIERSRENVPFPVIVEILLMEISFELIREAGVRVPDVIGQTLGIIGALILGQSAVAANLVSPILVIIVSITGLGNFAMPSYYMGVAIRILKFLFIFLAAIAGFYGLSLGIFIVGGFACSMKSFGIPYFAPIAPKTKINPDVIVRQPLWRQTMRPDFTNTLNKRRAGKIARGWPYKNKGGKKK